MRTSYLAILKKIVIDGEDPKKWIHLFSGVCPHCRKTFEKNRTDQEYCSDNCRASAAAHRFRKRLLEKNRPGLDDQ